MEQLIDKILADIKWEHESCNESLVKFPDSEYWQGKVDASRNCLELVQDLIDEYNGDTWGKI